MKKIICAALVCAMLLSALAVGASAAAEKYKGDPSKGYGLVEEVQAYALPTAPTFDFDSKGNPSNETLAATGSIDRAVWGEPTVVAKAADANTAFTTTPNDNVLFVFDSVYEEMYKEDKDTAAYTENGTWEKLSYRLWLAWDNDYYYVAAEIDDPDGYSLPTGSSSIWDGDCLQFMIDPVGPNGVMKYADFNYDYKTQCFDWWTYKRPWYNLNTVMNLGVGDVVGLKRNEFQVVNMSPAEAGTVINDPKSKRGIKMNIVNANKNTVNPGMTVLEVAIPWNEIIATAAYTGNITMENVGAGYILGMSASVLNGTAGVGDGGWTSYLNWGSGVTGASTDTEYSWFQYNDPGSNAVVLNSKSAVDHATEVAGAKVAKPIEPVPHIDEVMFSDIGDSDNQLPTQDTQYYNVESGIAAALDIAITGVDPTDVSRSLVGWWIGDGYSIYAGYDISTKTFVVGQQDAGNGLNRDIIYKRSDLTYDWTIGDVYSKVAGEWHRLGIKIVGNTVELFFDGKSVLTCTHDRIGHHIVGEAEAEETGVAVGTVTDWLVNQSFVLNNTAACVFDNYIAGTPDYNLKGIADAKATKFLFKYTFDSDDPEWNASPMRSSEAQLQRLAYKPLDEEGDAYYAAKPGETEPGPSVKKGDANGDGKLNSRDVVLVMKAALPGFNPPTSGWNFEAADFDGNGKINSRDVIAIMKAVLTQ